MWQGPRAAPTPAGSPALLILTLSAPRAAAMLKPLGVFHARVAKLFGRHLSPAEQAAILRGPPCAIAVGTPHRVAKLLDDGALSLERCSLVLVDAHPDVKGYSVLTMPAVKDDLFSLLREHLHAKLAKGALKLGVYG